MDKLDERNLRLIKTESPEEAEKTHPTEDIARQNNPILKKLLKFHNEGIEKFSVIDLFRK